MKKFLSSLGLFAALSFSGAAIAEVEESFDLDHVPVHTHSCLFTYDVKGGGVQVGIGYFKLTGTGKIRCTDIHSSVLVVDQDVDVVFGGNVLAPRVGIGWEHMKGASASFNLEGSIDQVYGDYLVAGAEAGVGLGVGSNFSVKDPRHGITMNLTVEALVGLVVEAGLSVMTISPARVHHHPHHCHGQQQQ